MSALDGLGVLLTRPSAQSQALIDLLRARGSRALALPLFEIQAAPDSAALSQQLQDARHYAGWIFTSANAARLAAERLEHPWPRQFAIGSATAAALLAYGHGPAEMAPRGSTSEALLDHPALQQVSGQHFLICTGAGGRVQLEHTLRARGAVVERAELYRRVAVTHSAERIEAGLRAVDALICTSAESLERLLELTPAALVHHLRTRVLVVPSLRVLELARRLGFEASFAPDHISDEAFVDCLEHAFSQRSARRPT